MCVYQKWKVLLMESVLVFEFEQCVEIYMPKKPVSMRDFCYRPLPDAHFTDHALDILKAARKLHLTTVLVAYGDESLVKEALLSLKACVLFSDFLILDEQADPSCHTRETATRLLKEKYGNSFRYITDFSKILV